MTSRSSDYRSRRDFSQTPEPRGGRRKPGDRPVFVIHEHDASQHHFDFRLEVDGALRSWAVPKGPSTDPRERRLAIETEDHPLDYADFEGVIPEGQYGTGAVLVWDRGTYENLTERNGQAVDPARALARGHFLFRLNGEKLVGGYALQRMEGDDWLLVKMDDDDADARRNPVSTETESVLSGRDLSEIEKTEKGES